MLGKYEILRKLATGGMAEIYLARSRGHGRVREARRDQADPADGRRRSGVRPDVPRRGAARRDAPAPEHRGRLRGRRGRRLAVLRDGVHPRPGRARDPPGRARAQGGRAARDRARDRPRHGGGARLRARQDRPRRRAPPPRPPRRLVEQRARQLRGRDQADRLRHRARDRAWPPDAGRHAQGQDPVHVAGAVPRLPARSAQRPVLARRRDVRAHGRTPAVPRRQRLRDHGADRPPGRAAALDGDARVSARARGDRDEAARAQRQRALPDRRGAAPRPRSVHRPAPAVGLGQAAEPLHARARSRTRSRRSRTPRTTASRSRSTSSPR